MSSIYNPSPAFRDAADYLSNAPAMKSVSDATKLEVRSSPDRARMPVNLTGLGSA